MNILVSNIEALFHFAKNGHITIVIGICILFIFLLIAFLNKERQTRSLKKEVRKKQVKIDEFSTNFERHSRMLHSQIFELKKELRNTTAKLERRNNRIEALNQSISEKSDEINILLNEKKVLEFALKKAEQTFKVTDDLLKRANESIAKRNQELIAVKSEVSILNEENSKSQEIITSLNIELDTIKKSQNNSNPFERLVNW